MGQLLKPRGLDGSIWLRLFNDENSSLKYAKNVWIKKINENYFNLLVDIFKNSVKKSWIRFNGFNSREDAEKISGLDLFLSRKDFVILDDRETYLVDLIGIKVLDSDKNNIGVVIDTIIMPAQTLLVIDSSGSEILVPFAEPELLLFDRNKNVIMLNDVEGLLD